MALQQQQHIDIGALADVSHINRYAIVSEPNGECVLQRSNDDENVMVQSTYNIENSNNVVIGAVNHFHDAVTFIQKSDTKNLHATQQEAVSSGPPHIIQDKPKAIRPQHQHFKARRKVVLVLIAIVFFIVLLVGLASYFSLQRPKMPANAIDLNGSQLLPREFWSARPPLSVLALDTPVKYVIISHTNTEACDRYATCAPKLQTFQSEAVGGGEPDIYWNFMIVSDASVYEGRGWDAVNSAKNHSIIIAFIGNYSYDDFTKEMQQSLRALLALGVAKGKLTEDYTLLSRSQTMATLSPGPKIRDVIRTWEHYYPKDYIDIPD